MEIYIEYALLENFLYDGVLLWLACTAVKRNLRIWRLMLSAGLGAVFALCFPYLRLQGFFAVAVKFLAGILLCGVVFGKVNSVWKLRRFLLTVVLFFAFSFAFGGTLLAVYGPLSMGGFSVKKAPSWFVFLCFIGLTGGALALLKCLYRRRAIWRCVYPCKLRVGGDCARGEGFLDSGNLATHKGKPICFVSPVIIYDLFGNKILKESGQVCEEMSISTLTGTRTIPLYLGEIEVETEEGIRPFEVYFAPSRNMIKREYAVLLNGRMIEELNGENAVD